MEERHASAQRIALLVHSGGVKRHGVNAMYPYQRVARVLRPMQIEFLLEKPVKGRIERKRIARRLRDAANTIQVETLGAAKEEVDLGMADSKRRGRARNVEAVGTRGLL